MSLSVIGVRNSLSGEFPLSGDVTDSLFDAVPVLDDDPLELEAWIDMSYSLQYSGQMAGFTSRLLNEHDGWAVLTHRVIGLPPIWTPLDVNNDDSVAFHTLDWGDAQSNYHATEGVYSMYIHSSTWSYVMNYIEMLVKSDADRGFVLTDLHQDNADQWDCEGIRLVKWSPFRSPSVLKPLHEDVIIYRDNPAFYAYYNLFRRSPISLTQQNHDRRDFAGLRVRGVDRSGVTGHFHNWRELLATKHNIRAYLIDPDKAELWVYNVAPDLQIAVTLLHWMPLGTVEHTEISPF